MIQFMLLTSRQGKPRLIKWFADGKSQSEMQRESRQVINMVLRRPPKACNIIEWQDYKLVYKRYASLYFITCIENTDNELMALDTIHLFVEVLDRYFGNVCELDLIFNFHKAYYILDEVIMSGELQESSKKSVLRYIADQDVMMEEKKDAKPTSG